MTIYQTSLFIFRRDLRIHDNTALNTALGCSNQVIAGFILDDRQIKPHKYQSKPALSFMLESLADLEAQLQAVGTNLSLFEGLPTEIITQLHKQHTIQAVFINRDYTPFSRLRDYEMAQQCQALNIAFHVLPDALLTEPEQAVKSDGSPYKVFTAFYNNARQLPVPVPQDLKQHNFLDLPSTVNLKAFSDAFTLPTMSIQAGRTGALSLLDNISRCADYTDTRDFPALDSTSHLSAHLKFGTVSVREVFYGIVAELGQEHLLIRQLYWRDFFTHIAFHFPKVFGASFTDKYNALVWDNDRLKFSAWSEGKTGFPIVDAGMRELNATGFMHNRVRMIVASFLVKDLHISWRWGERYFAQHLMDYDPCVNNGNWQWAASTGVDAQPYFRIFNPWLQQQKFDPDCEYIYRWIPELKSIPVKTVHQWDKKHCEDVYLPPIIDHSLEVISTKNRFVCCGLPERLVLNTQPVNRF
jgi:deoxyribodipyrimidine photo-lyase